MELEELGALLNNNIDQTTLKTNTMIYQSTAGPLASYAKNLKFTLFAFPCAAILFTAEFIDNATARHSPTKWLLLTVLSVEFVLAIFNFIVVKSIKNAEGNVKQNLLNKVSLMQRASTWFLRLHLFLYGVMAVVLELSMHYKLELDFSGWSNVNVGIRILTYIAFLVLQYFIKRASYKKHYGRYLDKVQQLAGQLAN